MKKIIYILVIAMLVLTGCSDEKKPGNEEKKQNDIEGAEPPRYISLEFHSMESLIECINSNGESYVKEDYVQGIEIENYPELIKIKESGEIPILVDAEGNSLVEDCDRISIQGRLRYESEVGMEPVSLNYVTSIDNNNVRINIWYLEEEFLMNTDEPVVSEYHEYCRNRGLMLSVSQEKKIQIADREVDALVTEEYGKIKEVTFLYDGYKVHISIGIGGLTYDRLSDITVGHVDIE